MIRTGEITIESVTAVRGNGETPFQLVQRVLPDGDGIGGIVAATFSNPERFPALSVRAVSALGLPATVPAVDIQMACSAYPYALYLAGKLSADTGRRILVLNGDVQSPLVDADDPATGKIFSDAMTATVVRSSGASDAQSSLWDFYSRADESLTCSATGPIRMNGFKVFAFVATEVSRFLRTFLEAARQAPETTPDCFVPHAANPYMIRQLARSLSLEDKLLTLPDEIKNPGSCSIPLTLARLGRSGRVLIAGFGAGLSASAGIVRLSDGFTGKTIS